MLRASRWLGALLLCSVALQLVAAFLRYATITPEPVSGPLGGPGAAENPISFSYYDGLRWDGRLWFFLTLGIIAILGCLLIAQQRARRAAFVVGFCGSAMGVAAYLFSGWITSEPAHYKLGPGYLTLLAGFVVEAAVAAWLFVVLWLGTGDRERVGSLVAVLAFTAAVLLGTSTALRPVRFAGLGPLAMFSPLTLASGIAAVVAFATIAVLPILAIRWGSRVGAAVVWGLAFHTLIQVLDAFGASLRFLSELTIGWWIEASALLLLVVIGVSLTRAVRMSPETSALETVTP
jgi:hypothetical protein